jgi:hypothetical protein
MDDGYRETRILWQFDDRHSAERFVARRTPDGWRLAGVVVLPIDGEPAEIRYHVTLDGGWRTEEAGVAIDAGPVRRAFAFSVDARGRWRVDGEPMPALDGCVDIDLGFTPATNTLQIRRLGLGVGESRTLPVAWLSFPELEVQPLTQTYERLAEDRWRYGDPDTTTDLLVDAHGFVLRYGDDAWRAVARSTA